MRHCLFYAGSFERNFPSLTPGTTTFEGSDGATHPLPPIPAEVDGVRVGYMEKAGKKFCAVRVQAGTNDIPLQTEVLLDAPTHLGHGNRFGPEPTIVTDEIMATLLADIMARNPEQRMQLANARATFSLTQRDGGTR